MKPASEWKDEFCNHYIINIRGQEVEDFIREIQADAIRQFLVEKEVTCHPIMNPE